MKLRVTKSLKEHEGRVTGFVFEYKVELSDEEIRLQKKYDYQDKNVPNRRQMMGKTYAFPVDFIEGVNQEFSLHELPDALDFEAEVKRACQRMKEYLTNAESYPGTEEFEF